jgi:hypothetical protein
MATNYLPDDHHVVRHVSGNNVERDGDQVLGIFPQAFRLRDNEEYLSASWLEYFHGSKKDRLKATREAMRKARDVRPSHVLAVGNVLAVKDACKEFGLKVRVCHEPDGQPNPAYTAVRRFSSENDQLLDLLSSEAWSDIFEARTLG